MTTPNSGVAGFSSRSTTQTIQQYPQRDEAAMTDLHPEPGFANSEPVVTAPQDKLPDLSGGVDGAALQPEAGFSNSPEVEHAPKDHHPRVHKPEALEPGFTNDKAVVDPDAPPEPEYGVPVPSAHQPVEQLMPEVPEPDEEEPTPLPVDPETPPPADPPVAPAKSASAAAWAEYARSVGASEADLVGQGDKPLTKRQLIAKYAPQA